jgi:uncharacterized membrane protein (UPF0127 family)
MPMRAAVIALASLAGVAAECSRTPTEDFPSRSAASTATPAVPSAASSAVVAPAAALPASTAQRCVLATPAAAPSPVAPGPAAGCPADPEGNQRVPVVRVTFPDAGSASVDAELVSTPHDTQRGLMYRRSMPAEHGMLFDLHSRDDHQFWMHNTCIPLDLLYIDEDGFVAGIVENAPTLDDGPRGVGCPSRFVLEVNAGWCRRHHVVAGQHVGLPGELAPQKP